MYVSGNQKHSSPPSGNVRKSYIHWKGKREGPQHFAFPEIRPGKLEGVCVWCSILASNSRVSLSLRARLGGAKSEAKPRKSAKYQVYPLWLILGPPSLPPPAPLSALPPTHSFLREESALSRPGAQKPTWSVSRSPMTTTTTSSAPAKRRLGRGEVRCCGGGKR